MAAIEEDITEELTTPTNTTPPVDLIPDSIGKVLSEHAHLKTARISLGAAGKESIFPRPGRSSLGGSESSYTRPGRTSLGGNDSTYQRPGRTSLGGGNDSAYQRPGRTSLGGGNDSAYQRPGRTSLGTSEPVYPRAVHRSSMGGEVGYPRTGMTSLSSGNEPPYKRSVSPGDETRQRRSGAIMLQQQPQNTLNSEVQGSTTVTTSAPVKNGLHHLLTTPNTPPVKTTPTTSQSQVLLGMLQTPIPNTQQLQQQQQQQQQQNQQTTVISSGFNVTSTMNSYNNSLAILQIQQLHNHVSAVLKNFGIRHVHQNNIFTVDHHGVRFHIHVSSNIQLQYIAGDMNQFQSLCTQLYSQLVPSAH